MPERTSDLRGRIAGMPLFEGLPGNYIENLTQIAAERDYCRGQFLFAEGEPGTGFYVLLTGRAKIFKIGAEGKEQILHVFGPGEPFGEVPVFEGGQYPAHAAALEDSSALFFPRDAFVRLIEKDAGLALNMLAILSRRLRRFTALIESLSLKEVPGRLAAYLLYASAQDDEADEVQLDVAKGQLASLLGTIPETLSRILTKMTREGFIQSAGPRTIRIRDREGLEDLASGERRLS